MHYRADTIAPTYTLSWSHGELEGLHSPVQRELCTLSAWLAKDWVPHELVAQITVGLVTWWAQDRCLLSVRERWDGQSWCEAGRDLGRGSGAAHGDGGWLSHLLILLSITASALHRYTTRAWLLLLPPWPLSWRAASVLQDR